MPLHLHTIKTANKKPRKRVGRGSGSGRGTYAGRGLKGQRARSGGKKGLKIKGFKSNLLRIPKLRGFNSPKPKKQIVKLSILNKYFNDGDSVNPRELAAKDLIKDVKIGVKVLLDAKTSKKLNFQNCWFSKSAENVIIKSGGKIQREDSPATAKEQREKK
ncbi:MAG: 50S ribosomal protein L15 [Patescibacteria group bacterium]